MEEDGEWPDGLLDAYISMIPKTDGNATPLGQRPLCVLPIAYRLWASTKLQQLQSWFESWVPESVFCAGGGKSSVEAWYSTALDMEESLSGALDSDVHIFVAGQVCLCCINWLDLINISKLLSWKLGRQKSALTFAAGKD